MRTSRYFVLAFIGIASQAGAVNLLSNPGFETGSLAPWFNNFSGGGTPWFVQGATVHSGSFAAQAIGNMGFEQDFTPTPVAQITQVAFWLKNGDSGALINGIDFIYTDTATEFFLIFSPNTNWNFVDQTANLHAGKTLKGIQIYGFSGGGPDPDLSFVDDAIVNTPVPEPATLAALGLGVAAVLRRKRR